MDVVSVLDVFVVDCVCLDAPCAESKRGLSERCREGLCGDVECRSGSVVDEKVCVRVVILVGEREQSLNIHLVCNELLWSSH